MPFPGTRILPHGWSQHHAPAIATAANGTCVVIDPTRSTPGALDPATGARPAATPHYVAGTPAAPIRCRIQALASAHDTRQADQASTERAYLVQLVDADLSSVPDIEEGHIVRVVAAENDPHLTGVDLTVRDVQHGTERFTRDLVATHNQQPERG